MSDTLETVKVLLGKTCNIDPSTIRDHGRLIALGLDSVRATDFLIAIEEEFGVVIAQEEAAELQTVAEVVSFVDQRK